MTKKCHVIVYSIFDYECAAAQATFYYMLVVCYCQDYTTFDKPTNKAEDISAISRVLSFNNIFSHERALSLPMTHLGNLAHVTQGLLLQVDMAYDIMATGLSERAGTLPTYIRL